MTLNGIHTVFHIFIVTGGIFVLWCYEAASLQFYIHACIYLQILIISCLATFLGTKSLSVLIIVQSSQSINQSINWRTTCVRKFVVLRAVITVHRCHRLSHTWLSLNTHRYLMSYNLQSAADKVELKLWLLFGGVVLPGRGRAASRYFYFAGKVPECPKASSHLQNNIQNKDTPSNVKQ